MPGLLSSRPVLSLDVLIQPAITPAESVKQDRWALRRAAAATDRGVLRVYDFAGEVLSLGRYHLAPPPAPSGLRLHRRLSGGRVAPAGDGFVGVGLVVPHRSALVSSDALALKPEQVLNRCVRGLMHACRLAGLDPIYPGLDTLTVRQRPFALVSFEIDASGALLFEAVMANTRSFAALPALLDRADPDGVMPAAFIAPEEATSLAAELNATLSTAQWAELIARGYEAAFEVRCQRTSASPVVQADDTEWLHARRRRPDLDQHRCRRTQLGVLEAYFRATPDHRLIEVLLAGDFIAPSAVIERLEAALRGCPVRAEAIVAIVSRVFAGPDAFILGIGPLATIASAICEA